MPGQTKMKAMIPDTRQGLTHTKKQNHGLKSMYGLHITSGALTNWGREWIFTPPLPMRTIIDDF